MCQSDLEVWFIILKQMDGHAGDFQKDSPPGLDRIRLKGADYLWW